MSFSSDYRRSSYKKEIVWRKIINFSNIDYRLSSFIDFRSTIDYRLSKSLSTFRNLIDFQAPYGWSRAKRAPKSRGISKIPRFFCFWATVIILCKLSGPYFTPETGCRWRNVTTSNTGSVLKGRHGVFIYGVVCLYG